jgi:hypothetical protein
MRDGVGERVKRKKTSFNNVLGKKISPLVQSRLVRFEGNILS